MIHNLTSPVMGFLYGPVLYAALRGAVTHYLSTRRSRRLGRTTP